MNLKLPGTSRINKVMFFIILYAWFIGIITSSCTNKVNASLQNIVSTIDGNAWVQKSNSPDWIAATPGMKLDAGDKVKTDIDSSVAIVLFEGSVVELESGTEVELFKLLKGKGNATTIKISQSIGTTISRVKKLVDPESIFEIETTAAVVGVRGTTMKVSVVEDGTTVVENIEGLVGVVAQGAEVIIPAGKMSTIIPGEPPSPPQPAGPQTVELTYDSGKASASIALGNVGHGYLVRFSPPGTPFTIDKVRMYGSLYGTGYEDKQFVLRITDATFDLIMDNSYPCSLFPRVASWIDIDIPDIVVNGDFYVEIFTNSIGTGGIAIFYDFTIPNQHSSELQDWTKEEWKLAIPRETTNWMIRVVGQLLPTALPAR